MKQWRKLLIPAGLLLVIIAFANAVREKEQLLKNGELVYLRLAPVDPRSLMQGDYMTLNYHIPNKLMKQAREQIEGQLVFIKEMDNTATFVRVDNTEQALADNEKLMHFRVKRWRVDLGANSFFFQEGKAEDFNGTRFGEVRVDDEGHSILVGLRDKDFKLLGFTSGLAAGEE